MNFIIPYYSDERLKYTQKYLKKAGYNEVFDKSEANFAVFAPACDKEMFKGYENVNVFYGVGDYDKKYKNCFSSLKVFTLYAMIKKICESVLLTKGV